MDFIVEGKKKVLISIPAFNEELTIMETIHYIQKVMDSTEFEYLIIVRDDGSTDKTVEVALENGAKVESNPYNLGLAETFKRECQTFIDSEYEIMVHTDADNQYKAEHIPELIQGVLEGNDLVMGSRFLGGTRYSGMKTKSLGNRMFSWTLSKIIGTKCSDVTTGFRAFNKKVASLPIINRFTYTHEQIIRAKREGLKIKEIPISTNETRKDSRLFKNNLDYALKAFINILRVYRDFNPIKFFGSFGILVMIPGIILGLFSIIGMLITGPGGYTKYALSALFLFLMGMQIIIFSFIADMNVK